MDNQESLNNVIIPKIMQRLGVPESKAKKFAKHMILPREGMQFSLNGFMYKVVYIRQDPFRFTAEPIGIVDNRPKKKEGGESWKKKIGKILKKKPT